MLLSQGIFPEKVVTICKDMYETYSQDVSKAQQRDDRISSFDYFERNLFSIRARDVDVQSTVLDHVNILILIT